MKSVSRLAYSTVLGAMFCLAPWTLPAAAPPGDLAPPELTRATSSGNGNQARIDQQGLWHEAAINQQGDANQAGILQRGMGHEALIDQQGSGNDARIMQFGWVPQAAAIQQVGDINNARVEQRPGTRTGVEVLQHGDGLNVEVTVGR